MLLHLLLQLNQLPFPMVALLFAQTSTSNASGNLQTKVLLTVSPFRSSFLQPPALRPANHRFFTPLFSTSSVSLFSQLLCFHIYLRCLLVFFDSGYRFSRDTDSRATNHGFRVHVLSSVSPFRMNTCKSVSKQRTLTKCRMNTYAKPRGGVPHTRWRDKPISRLSGLQYTSSSGLLLFTRPAEPSWINA